MVRVASYAVAVVWVAFCACAFAQETRVMLKPEMVVNEERWGNPRAMVDEQDGIGDPPKAEAKTHWETDWSRVKDFPISAYIDLGRERRLSVLWVYDTFDSGALDISTGEPGKWRKTTSSETKAFKQWVKLPLDVTTRYLRLTRNGPSCQFAEIALYEYTPEAWKALEERKAAEAREAEQKRLAMEQARREAANRPVVDLGELFGKATLVDEIDCATEKPDHLFAEYPAGASRVEMVLGQKCRVLPMQGAEASYVSWRIGRYKLLKPGATYVLSIEYPEDVPRSMIIMNGGCETSRGFHTGTTTGDALRARYVWSNPESLNVPLARKYEVWKQFFQLHDRFPERGFIRGAGPRALTPDDGFPVTIAQFSAENDPPSRGIAVRRIRLFEIADMKPLGMRINYPPEGLPRRHIFWREEMADGVIDSDKPDQRGVANAIDWYRHKAMLMRLLGINTFAKDLLEFGACQHWDSSPGGGHDWVFYAERHKDLWGKIVELMGREGFSILPYYEYAGSRGYKGLGNQRRARPLTRDDAYTHIQWIEQANADITDPDTLADFKKMLDLTIVRFKDKATFEGAWIRPRSQLPISFGDATRERFAKQANGGVAVTRQQLIDDKPLRQKYYDWWFGQRRVFLQAVCDHLVNAGVNPEAVVLFTADASEPGVSFPTWDRQLVTDDLPGAAQWLKVVNMGKDRPITPLSIEQVVRDDLYLRALLSAPLDWGKWEVGHASPAADPQRYREAAGVMMTHGFNRAYTVASAKTMDLFRTPSGLVVIRHYALNENMMIDKDGKDLLGYFVADVERAGPYCMLAEARAMAGGDPRYIGYLVGSCFNRGFPEYVRDFNAAFLALPALPSRRVEDACEDREVVVRAIDAGEHGTWVAVVNTGLAAKQVKIKLPAKGVVSDAATGREVTVSDDGTMTLSLRPCQLRSMRIRSAVP